MILSLHNIGDDIEGIFVSDEMQSQGIGKALVDFIKAQKTKLRLNVYQKNMRATHFYQKKGLKSNVRVWMKLRVKKIMKCCGGRDEKSCNPVSIACFREPFEKIEE